MSRTAVLLMFAMILCTAAPVWSMVIPTFSTAEYIHWGPAQLVVENEYNGCMANVADWDGDGVKDLLVGVYQEGAIYFYPNTGTNHSPVFDERFRLSADGTAIILPAY